MHQMDRQCFSISLLKGENIVTSDVITIPMTMSIQEANKAVSCFWAKWIISYMLPKPENNMVAPSTTSMPETN